MKYNKFSLFMCALWLIGVVYFACTYFMDGYDPRDVLIALMSLCLAIRNYDDAARGK